MGYDLNTIQDIRRRLKQAPQDLKVVTLHDGLGFTIREMRVCYVKPWKNFAGDDCFITAEKDDHGSIQVLEID